jgi:hypothetical protein
VIIVAKLVPVPHLIVATDRAETAGVLAAVSASALRSG